MDLKNYDNERAFIMNNAGLSTLELMKRYAEFYHESKVNNLQDLNADNIKNEIFKIWEMAKNHTLLEIGEICKGDVILEKEEIIDFETFFNRHYR